MAESTFTFDAVLGAAAALVTPVERTVERADTVRRSFAAHRYRRPVACFR